MGFVSFMGLLKFNFMQNIRKQANGLRELNPYDSPTKVKKKHQNEVIVSILVHT